MIRMTVRYPYKFAIFDGMHLFIWYLVRESPATKIRTSFDPRISYQHGATIVANECRVTNGFKTYIHCCFPLSQRMTAAREWYANVVWPTLGRQLRRFWDGEQGCQAPGEHAFSFGHGFHGTPANVGSDNQVRVEAGIGHQG